ncbi:MAG: transketolase [Calditrichia bacterium]
MDRLAEMTIEEASIHTIRTLAIDAIQKANSGHPGAPMALAPVAYVLWKHHMRFNPRNPRWINRDRFVLSNGHASMLLYALLYLSGFDLSLEEIKNFRQWGSQTPGHPEHGLTPGVETTTGPLGQGFMNALGMAMAEAHLAAVYNRENHPIIDHYTFVLCSDGDLMEGASHEAASVAGHLGLGKLIAIYDDNRISIEGKTEITYSDDVAKRFESYHWHVQNIGDNANDLEAVSRAISRAKAETGRPSLIIVQSHIGYGSPNMQDTPEVHGSPLGEEEVRLTKKFYGWPEDAHFLVPERVLQHMRECVENGQKWEAEWNEKFEAYRQAYPELAEQFLTSLKDDLPQNWDQEIPQFKPEEGAIATRSASGKVINGFAQKVPWFMGGSADLAPSTKTLIKNTGYFARGQYANRNIAWGVREHVMCAASSGICLHGGIRPFASTFFVFTDYARPAIRLAAMMKLPMIYVMTHDSIGLGEDGPTHQPVEHLASFRAMPHLCLIRPADANETAYAWRAAMLRKTGPTMLVLSRQNLPILDRTHLADAAGVLRGAYVLSPEKGTVPDIILMASGSEVQIILEAQEILNQKGIDTRVVSMPSWELFEEQPQSYREQVLPHEVKARLAIEAGSSFGWQKWVGEGGETIGIDRFGASAPYREIYHHFGLTVENVVEKSMGIVRKFAK